MNHNFKLKSGETSVTNDAELLNYALKSAREEPWGREDSERKEPLFVMVLVETLQFLLFDVEQLAALTL